MGVILECTETKLFSDKNEFLYMFILVWFKTKQCLQLANWIFIWNSVVFFVAIIYYFLVSAEKKRLFFSQKVGQKLLLVPVLVSLTSNQNPHKMLSNNSKSYSYDSYIEDSTSMLCENQVLENRCLVFFLESCIWSCL